MPNMRQRPCCVPGCSDKILRRYAIPAEKRVRDIWIERIGNPKLVGRDDSRFLKNYVVCEQHFSDMCKDSSKGLLKFSLPALKCPNFSGLSTRENCFSYPEKPKQFVTPEKVREALKRVHFDEAMPTTFKDEANSDLKVNISGKVYSSQQSLNKQFLKFGYLDQLPSTSTGIYSTSSSTAGAKDFFHIEGVELLPVMPDVDILPQTPSPCHAVQDNVENLVYRSPP